MDRLKLEWFRIRDSLWFIPGVFTLLAAIAAVVLVQLERGPLEEIVREHRLFFGAGADGAREVLSAIASSLITVTGVVFSVTVVALQLASSQFTPRVLRNFMADRANQVVLGIFIGTFTYALLVLRTVRSPVDDTPGFVPVVATTIAVGLVLVSIGALIFFINHAASSIQVGVVLDRITRDALELVDQIFPATVGRPDEDAKPELEGRPDPVPVLADRSGYLQALSSEALFSLAAQHDILIRMEPTIGDFLLKGETLALVWPRNEVTGGLLEEIQESFLIGADRTPSQDIQYGLGELSEIAVRALSPGVNDPTTASRAIDRISEVLLAFGNRFPPPVQRTAEGRIHFIARHVSYERAIDFAIEPILHAGAGNPSIVQRLVDTLTRVAELVPGPRKRATLAMRAKVLRAADHAMENPIDRREVSRAHARILD